MAIFNNVFNKKQDKLLEAELAANGLAVGNIYYPTKSKFSRVQLCFIRALLIFLAAFGTVGSMVSAFDLPFMLPVVLIGSLIICSYIAFLYYNRFTFYVGYILYFLVFTSSIFSLYWYVNSGAQAFLNTVYEKYSDHFALLTYREATEFITDRRLTVTITMLFVVAFLALLLNITISGYMSLIETFLITFPLVQITLYIDFKPNMVYLVMLLAVYITVAILGRSSHYRIPDFKSSNQDFASIRSKKKNESKISHSYISDGGSIVTTSVFSVILCTIFLIATSIIFYSDLGSEYAKNKLKDTTDEYVKMYIQNGLWGFFDRYSAKGGINGGMLGGISSVRPDYETDLVIQFVPVNVNSIYLKSYVGNYYSYNLFGAESLSSSYDSDTFCIADHIPSGIGQAKMRIENIDASTRYDYMPYYGVSIENKISDEFSTRYEGYYIPAEYVSQITLSSAEFPLVPANELSDEQVDYAYQSCTNVPEYLNECLDTFIDETELSKYKGILEGDLSLEDRQRITIEICEALRREYLNNFYYTMAPGATPRNKDTVEFFLTKQKRGYCVHFASSSALILRRLGIPTRYVEGYMVSLTDIMDAEAISTDTEGWVSETLDSPYLDSAVVSLEVTDGSAHAWTEIYIDGYGWMPYEFTPPSTEDSITDFSLGALFSQLFRTRPETDGNNPITDNIDDANNVMSKFAAIASLGFIIYPMICVIIFIIVLIFGIKFARLCGKLLKIQHLHSKGNYNDAFQLRYALFYAYAKNKLSIAQIDLTPSNMSKILCDLNIVTGESKEKLDELTNTALYSSNRLNKDTFADAINTIKECKKAIAKYKKPKDKTKKSKKKK